MELSARNQLKGEVVRVKSGTIMPAVWWQRSPMVPSSGSASRPVTGSR
jgi:hypothetical protein